MPHLQSSPAWTVACNRYRTCVGFVNSRRLALTIRRTDVEQGLDNRPIAAFRADRQLGCDGLQRLVSLDTGCWKKVLLHAGCSQG